MTGLNGAQRTPWGRIALVWLVISALLLLINWQNIAQREFLDPNDVLRLVQVRDLLAALCVDFDGSNEGELCDDAVVLRLSCANGPLAHKGSDRCRREDPRGRRIEVLRAALFEQLDLASWVGEPTNRQACTRGALDLAPHELARTISLDLPES